MGIDSDLIRGHIDTIILKILFSGDKYGYEICKEVEERSNGTYELKQPTLYSCLKRLEDKGFISSYWEDSDIGGKRHYYKLTESGKDEYNKNQQEWLKSRSIIDDLIFDEAIKETSSEDIQPDEISETSEPSEEISEITSEDNSLLESNDSENVFENATQEESYDEILLNNDQEDSSPINDETLTTDAEDSDTAEYENYDIMSMLGHYDTPKEDVTLQENLEELESAQSILDSFDKKYSEFEVIQENIEDEQSSEEQFVIDEPINTNLEESSLVNQLEEQSMIDNINEENEETESFNFNDYLNGEDSYFDSEEAKSPIKTYRAPNIVIDGLENETETEDSSDSISNTESTYGYENDETEDEFTSDLTPSYIQFDDQGNSHEIDNSSDIYVDDSNIDYDEIYINPEEKKEDSLEEQNSSFMFDNYNRSQNEEDTGFTSFDIIPDEEEEPIESIQTTDFVSSPASTSTDYQNEERTQTMSNESSIDSFTPKYTDEEYKQLLNQLENVTDTSSIADKKIQMYSTDILNKNINKDYADLRNSLSEEGFTVRPHLHLVKESKETKNYVQSNKIKCIQSWITFGFITFALAIMYLILKDSAMYGFDIKYFLIGMAITVIIPAVYTVLYILNPHKKHIARFIPRASYIISILLSVQLLIIVYCVNLQLGFYSFSQDLYNHLLWIVPAIISLYPIVQTIIYHILYNSKRFHI